MATTTAHVINHTHWDREWFLTSVYTSRWIPGLIERLEALTEQNPAFHYLFDGQTLVLEDLAEVSPDHARVAHRLIAAGNLIVGPYYCQPDWKLTNGELLVRNLIYGIDDASQHGPRPTTGWMVDTFGHIGQSPQIHRLAGIEALYVWRGVPQLIPYFTWRGSDGSTLRTINLFGGYRNLYGVSHAPEVAVARLEGEVERLRPYYPTPDVPLFDGYDLEDNPEDPLTFYQQLGGIGPSVLLRESTAANFARDMADATDAWPLIDGELNSGKFGATFPGTLSSRIYLKVMAHDCEQLLLARCEPLATLAALRGRPYPADRCERWSRLLLQNAVHDCICGVSIDQVHEKMEFSYAEAFSAMEADLTSSLAAILADFAPGDYAVSTNPMPATCWLLVDGELRHVTTAGIGVWPVAPPPATGDVPTTGDAGKPITWRNAHYTASVDVDGIVAVDEGRFGRLAVSAENGDTYTEAPGDSLGALLPLDPPRVIAAGENHLLIRYESAWEGAGAWARATVTIQFDPSPLIRWTIDLNSRGVNFRVDLECQTDRHGPIVAGMPFDAVQRGPVDRDLLPRDVPAALARVLLGQRELNAVRTFPFQNYVAVSDAGGTTAVFARGLRAYVADDAGGIRLPLRRALEWLTAADLEDRVGDAGPFFYVPDAREERRVRFECAVDPAAPGAATPPFLARAAAFLNPPLLVSVGEGSGRRRDWPFWRETAPLSSLTVGEAGSVSARVYNPGDQPLSLSRGYVATDLWGRETGNLDELAPGQIATLRLPVDSLKTVDSESPAVVGADFRLRTPPTWRVGANQGRPDPAVLAQLDATLVGLRERLARLPDDGTASALPERLRREHLRYVLEREAAEAELTRLLNQRKLAQDGQLTRAYLYEPDAEIAALGLALNRLRIKRRIFDYVVQVI